MAAENNGDQDIIGQKSGLQKITPGKIPTQNGHREICIPSKWRAKYYRTKMVSEKTEKMALEKIIIQNYHL